METRGGTGGWHARHGRRQVWKGLLGGSLLLGMLAGCGVPSSSATPGTSTASTTRVTPTVADQTGCPQPAQIVQWPTPPAVVITSAAHQSTTTIRVGQAVEVALRFGHTWALAMPQTSGPLNLDAPAGYADTASQACIWHFTARQTGEESLTYSMTPICVPGTPCAQYIATFTFTINVTN